MVEQDEGRRHPLLARHLLHAIALGILWELRRP